jgi:hypothetical protein
VAEFALRHSLDGHKKTAVGSQMERRAAIKSRNRRNRSETAVGIRAFHIKEPVRQLSNEKNKQKTTT